MSVSGEIIPFSIRQLEVPGDGGVDSDLTAFPVGDISNCEALARSNSQFCKTPSFMSCSCFTGSVSPSNLREPSPRFRNGSSITEIDALAIF